MKQIPVGFILAGLLYGTTAFAENFAPTPLNISGQNMYYYDFHGTEVNIPVQVSGAPATVFFLVFSLDKHYTINAVRNGNLGWHYVNKIDTCLYISPPCRFTTGDNTILWNGRDKNGKRMYPGDYTYYLWGYDHTTAPKKATASTRFPRFDRSFMQTLDNDRQPLEHPVLYDAPQTFGATSETTIVRTKWIIGGDPSDASHAETTAYRGWAENSRIALHSYDSRYFFTQSLRPTGVLDMRKWEWVPNGEAILHSEWGDNGIITDSSALDPSIPLYSGPVSDTQGILYFTNVENTESGKRYSIACADENDGSIIKKQDLTPWYAVSDDVCTGFSSLSFTSGMLFLNSSLSPVTLMVSPYAMMENDSDFTMWSNGNGDGVGDKAANLDYSDPWACIDPARTPVAGALSADTKNFSLFPVEGVNGASFGAYAPDGTGIGYFQLPGMDKGSVYGLHIVDTGSAYDGLYYGGVSDNSDEGVWYTGYDSFKGTIAYIDDSGMFPYILIKNPSGGNILTPGSNIPITWFYLNDPSLIPPAVRIEFTPDSGVTWITLADSISAKAGSYTWTVPDVSSTTCQIQIRSISVWNITGYFTISGTSRVTDHDQPQALPISNRPNPFNPSTTISFTLPSSGQTSLTVYDITGRKVRELLSGSLPAGAHTAVWDGKDARGIAVSSGVYIARLSAGKFTATGKMLLVR